MTKGQWLQMNITTRALPPDKSSSETDEPSMFGSLNVGACVPSGSMVLAVFTIAVKLIVESGKLKDLGSSIAYRPRYAWPKGLTQRSKDAKKTGE